MKHQSEILGQRLENMKMGINQTVSYLNSIDSMLRIEKPNIEGISKEIDEIRDFLLWVQNQ